MTLNPPLGEYRVHAFHHHNVFGPLQVPAEGARPVLARGLPDVRMLRLSAGRGWVHSVHQGEHDPLQKGLLQVFNGAGTARYGTPYDAITD